MGCGASKEVVEEEIKEERRREKRKRERAEKKSDKKKKKKTKKSKKKKKKKEKEPQQTNVTVTLPPTEAPKEPQEETPPAPAPAPEPIKIIVEQPAAIQEPSPVVEQPPVHQQPPPPPQQPPQQFEPQSLYAAVPSTMGVSLEDLSDKICLIEQNIQLQSQTNEQIHRIILAIAANQTRAEQNQMAALPPAQPQLAIQPPKQPQIVQVPVPVPYQVPVTPHEPIHAGVSPNLGMTPMPSSQTDNMTSAVLEQHLAKLKHEQNLLIRDLNRIKRHGHYDPNSFKVRSILSYIENQQKAINQLESAVSAASFAENDFADFSFPSYSQPVAQPVGRPQTMNYKPTSSGHWNSNSAAALPPVGNTVPYGSMYSQQGNPNVNRMQIETSQNPQNPGFPAFY